LWLPELTDMLTYTDMVIHSFSKTLANTYSVAITKNACRELNEYVTGPSWQTVRPIINSSNKVIIVFIGNYSCYWKIE
jgi:hypothetical protein